LKGLLETGTPKEKQEKEEGTRVTASVEHGQEEGKLQ
jgi:hypothetical protein